MALSEFVEELSKRLGDAPLAPDELGRYSLPFEGGLVVVLSEPAEETFRLTGSVGHLPADPDAARDLLVKMLHWNFPRQKFQREILALEPNQTELVLFREGSLQHLRPYEFTAQVEAFLNSLEFWRKAAAPPRASPPSEPPPPLHIIMP